MREGLSEWKFGKTAPSPTASPLRAKDINPTTRQDKVKINLSTLNIIFENIIKDSVIKKEKITLHQNFCTSNFLKEIGARPINQNLFPSREKSGNTKRVVRVESVSPIAVRLKKEIIFFQKGERIP